MTSKVFNVYLCGVGGQGPVLLGPSDHKRPQEVAPVGQKLENGDRSENRTRERQDDVPVNAEEAGSIDHGCFFQFFG